MTSRDRMVLMVAVVLVVAGGFWMLVLGPRRHQASDLAKQVADQRAQLTTITQQAAATPAGRQTQTDDAAELAALGQAVPADDETASLMYQLQDAAGRARVKFNSFEPSGANGAPAGNAQAAAPPAPVAPASTGDSSSSDSSTPPADASAPATPGATPGPAGVQQMALSLVFDGRYSDLERFLRRVYGFTTVHGQTIRVSGRLLSIEGVQLSAAPSGFPDVRASISATAYIAPDTTTASTAGGAGSATPAAAAAAAPATASATPPVTPAMVGAGG